MSATLQDCDCSLRSFWDGPCEYHRTNLVDSPFVEKFVDYGAAVDIELNKMIDPIVEQSARELGWKAGQSV